MPPVPVPVHEKCSSPGSQTRENFAQCPPKVKQTFVVIIIIYVFIFLRNLYTKACKNQEINQKQQLKKRVSSAPSRLTLSTPAPPTPTTSPEWSHSSKCKKKNNNNNIQPHQNIPSLKSSMLAAILSLLKTKKSNKKNLVHNDLSEKAKKKKVSFEIPNYITIRSILRHSTIRDKCHG